MGEVNLTINGKNFGITCDDGQEQRVVDLGHYIDSRIRDISASGAAGNENHLLVLASLMLADEVFDLREYIQLIDNGEQPQGERTAGTLKQEELAIAEAIDHLADRIEGIADRIQGA